MFKIQAKKLKACASLIKEAGPIADAATLSSLCQSAIYADLNNKIDAARLKLSEDIDRKCPVNPFLDGQCAGLPVSYLYGCVEPKIECGVCLYLKAIGVFDGSVACDLFDDGLSNSSCEQVCGNGTVEGSEQCDAPDVSACVTGQECDASCQCVGVSHTCSFDGAVDNSTLQLCFGGFCISPFDISGAVDINCDPGTQDGNGARTCQCSLQTIAPFAVPGIGTACIDPLGPCPDGELDCDGGNSLSVDTVADAQIGACIGNAHCASQCAVYCSGMGKTVYASGCENFCENGTRTDLPCICDTARAPTCIGGIAGANDCPNGSCEGKDNEADTDCHCTCVDTSAGAASAAGTIGCNIGLAIRIEADAVCDHNQVLVEFPAPECAPFTSATATAVILQSNELAAPQGPYSESGANESCGNLDVGVTSGYELVSVLTFYDTTIGDILSRMTLDCQ